jgi:NADPH:quinone reductase-like Zn-dependent oxidoreductase
MHAVNSKYGEAMSYKKIIITEFGGPDKLKLVEEPNLPEPKAGQVRVKVNFTSAAFTDVMIRKGQYPEVKDKPPFSPGYDLVGVIDKLGEGATRFQVGQRVADLTVTGAYSEYICLPEQQLTTVPNNLDPADAVCLILSYVTAYQMLHRIAKIKENQSILVHGAGGAVGTAMLQLGKLLNLEMFGTASKPKHALVAKLGATPLDYKDQNWTETVQNASVEGVDAVFDPIGGQSFKKSFGILKPNGILVGYGFYDAVMGKGGNVPLDFMRLKLWNIWPNRRSTAFYSIGALRKSNPDWFSEDLQTLFDLLEEKRIEPVISKRMPLSEAIQAHEILETAGVQGKIVLNVSDTAS